MAGGHLAETKMKVSQCSIWCHDGLPYMCHSGADSIAAFISYVDMINAFA